MYAVNNVERETAW